MNEILISKVYADIVTLPGENRGQFYNPPGPGAPYELVIASGTFAVICIVVSILILKKIKK